jgi:hypothetical protein
VATQFAGGAHNILNWQMFFLGMAFMLLEVRAMADLSLLFGSTWIINSVIISAVMVVILLANFMAPWINERFIPFFLGGAILFLAFSTAISASSLIGLGPSMGVICGIVMYLFPLVFAATVFALLFRQIEQASSALAFNLIGGGIGIVLEYISMWSGVRALGFIGAFLYSMVLILHLIAKRSSHRTMPSG